MKIGAVGSNPSTLQDVRRSIQQIVQYLREHSGGSITVENADGSVSVENVNTIRFINCTVEDVGGGVVNVIGQIGTEPVLTALTDDMTSNTTPTGTVYAIAQATGYEAWKAFDRDNGTSWMVTGHADKWIAYIFPSAVTVQKLAIRAMANSGTAHEERYAPKHFRLEGSNDGTTWYTLLTVMGLSWSSAERKIWTCGSPGLFSFLRYRVWVVETQGGGAEDKCAIAEIEMLG